MFSLKVSQDMGLLGLVSVKAKKEVQHLQLFLSGEKIRRPTSLVADIYSMTLILIQCGLNSLERHLFPCSICLESKVRSIRYTSKLFMALERFALSSNLTVCMYRTWRVSPRTLWARRRRRGCRRASRPRWRWAPRPWACWWSRCWRCWPGRGRGWPAGPSDLRSGARWCWFVFVNVQMSIMNEAHSNKTKKDIGCGANGFSSAFVRISVSLREWMKAIVSLVFQIYYAAWEITAVASLMNVNRECWKIQTTTQHAGM